MKRKFHQKVLSVLLAACMVLCAANGVIAAPQGGPPAAEEPVSYADGLSELLQPNRQSGLVGFEDGNELAGNGSLVSVIVEFKDQPAELARVTNELLGSPGDYARAAARAESAQADFRAALAGITGDFEITAEFSVVFNGVSVTLPDTYVAALAGLDMVFAVYPDAEINLEAERGGAGASGETGALELYAVTYGGSFLTASVPNGSLVEAGEQVTFWVTPLDGMLLNVEEWKVNGNGTGAGNLTFALTVNEDVEVTAELRNTGSWPAMCPVCYTAVGNGTLTAYGGGLPDYDLVNFGDFVVFEAAPAPGYRVKGWTVDGVAQATKSDKLVWAVEALGGIDVTVEFEPIPGALYRVNYSSYISPYATLEASVPSGSYVEAGEQVTFWAMLKSINYIVKEWKVNGVVADASNLTFALNVESDVNVSVSFMEALPPAVMKSSSYAAIGNGALDAYFLGPDGSLYPNPGGGYTANGSLVYLATPDPGYRVKEWKVYGTAQATKSNKLVWQNPKDVTVEFEPMPGAAAAFIPGDLNGDGAVDMLDSVLLARYVAEWPGIAIDLRAADLNGDGEVDMFDAIILARHIAEWPGYEVLPGASASERDGEGAAEYVCSIGASLFESLEDAIAAVPANSPTTIKLLADIDEGGIGAVDVNITFDLNGYDLTADYIELTDSTVNYTGAGSFTAAWYASFYGSTCVFHGLDMQRPEIDRGIEISDSTITINGDVKLTGQYGNIHAWDSDIRITGSVSQDSNFGNYVIGTYNTQLKIDGNVIAPGWFIDMAYGGKFTVGGDIHCELYDDEGAGKGRDASDYAALYADEAEAEIGGSVYAGDAMGVYATNGASVTVGGKIYAATPYFNDGTGTIVVLGAAEYVCEIGDVGYETVKDAIDAVPEETPTIINLLANADCYEQDGAWVYGLKIVDKDITFSLNGFTLEFTEGLQLIRSGVGYTGSGELNLYRNADLSEDSSLTITCFDSLNDGLMGVADGTVVVNGDVNGHLQAYSYYTGNSVTINGDFTSKNDYCGMRLSGYEGMPTVVTVNGDVTVSSDPGWSGIDLDGDYDGEGVKLIVTGSVFYESVTRAAASDDAAIYADSAKADIGEDIYALDATGVYALNDSLITVGGKIYAATPYFNDGTSTIVIAGEDEPTPTPIPPSGPLGLKSSRDFFGLDALHDEGYTGEGIVVAVVDSGIDYNHPDFAGSFLTKLPNGNDAEPSELLNGYFYGRNFINTSIANNPMDDLGHGTHCAGIVGARGLNEPISALGVAPGVSFVAYKIINNNDSIPTSTIALRGMEAAVMDGCDILSMSWGWSGQSGPSHITTIAVNNICLQYPNVAVVICAGNSGPGTSSLWSPATSPLAITVANGLNGPTVITLTAAVAANGASVPLSLARNSFEAVLTDNDIFNSRLTKNASGNYEMILVSNTANNGMGTGTAAELSAMNTASPGCLKGKVVVVNRGQAFDTTVDLLNGYEAGALVVINGNGSDDRYYSFYQSPSGNYMPLFFLTYSQGQSLIQGLTRRTAYDVAFGGLSVTNTGVDGLLYESSRGPVTSTYLIKPDIMAIGTGVVSTVPGFYGTTHYDYSNAYGIMSGTSMATPHIAGLVALLRQQNPDMSVAEIKARIMNNADITSGNKSHVSGYGTTSTNKAGVYETGAGWVNMEKALKAEVYATASIGGKNIYTSNASQALSAAMGASINFGTVLTDNMATVPVFITNDSDTAKTFTVSVLPTQNGATSKDAAAEGIVVTFTERTISVNPGETESFDVIVYVPSTATTIGSYEGFVFITAGETVLRLPYAFYLSAGSWNEETPIFNDAFFHNAAISTGPNRQITSVANYSSNDSVLQYNFAKSYGRLYAYISDAEGKLTGDLEGSGNNAYTTNTAVGSDYILKTSNGKNRLNGQYYAYNLDAFGNYLGVSNTLTNMPEGQYEFALYVSNSTAGNPTAYYMLPFYVDNTLPELTLDNYAGGVWAPTVTGGSYVFSGTIFDAGTEAMINAGIDSELNAKLFGAATSQGDNILVIESGGEYFRALIDGAGAFSVTVPEDKLGASATVWYGDHFLPIGAQTDAWGANAAEGFDPAKLSYKLDVSGAGIPLVNYIAYKAANMSGMTVELASAPPAISKIKISLPALTSMAKGTNKDISVEITPAGADPGNIEWSSNNEKVAYVKDGKLYATETDGMAVITCTVTPPSGPVFTASIVVNVK